MQIDITLLINSDNPIWEEVIERYNDVGVMSKKYRKAVMEAIIQYARVKKIYLDHDEMSNVATQICKHFPSESEVSPNYFNLVRRNLLTENRLIFRKRTSSKGEIRRQESSTIFTTASVRMIGKNIRSEWCLNQSLKNRLVSLIDMIFRRLDQLLTMIFSRVH